MECSDLSGNCYTTVGLRLKDIGKFYSLQNISSPSDPTPEMFVQPGLFYQFSLSTGKTQFGFVEAVCAALSPLALPCFVTW